MVCLGIEINAQTGVLKIPESKLQEIHKVCIQFHHRSVASRNQLQKLLGKLLYISRCVKPARAFTNRILTTLREAPTEGHIKLSSEFQKDILWFNMFLKEFNGTVEIHKVDQPLQYIFIDASLTRVGAFMHGNVYTMEIPLEMQSNLTIVQIEASNILVALTVWGEFLRNKHILIWCDNMAVVQAMKFCRIRDPWLMACARTIWLLTAQFNLKVTYKHIPGATNRYADILSRWQIYKDTNVPEVKQLKKCKWWPVKSSFIVPSFEI